MFIAAVSETRLSPTKDATPSAPAIAMTSGTQYRGCSNMRARASGMNALPTKALMKNVNAYSSARLRMRFAPRRRISGDSSRDAGRDAFGVGSLGRRRVSDADIEADVIETW